MHHMKLSKKDLEELQIRYDAAFNMNQRYIDRLIECIELTSPLAEGLNVLYGFNDTGARVDRNIFDSTAQYASSVRANNLHSLIWPVGKHWGGIHSSDKDGSNPVYEDEITDTAFEFIEQSNLHDVAKSYFQDINVGCGALWIDSPSKDRPILFKNVVGMTIMPEFSDDPESVDCWFHKKINYYELKKIDAKKAAVNSAVNERGEMNEFDVICGYIDLRKTHGGYVLAQFLKSEGSFDSALSEDWQPYCQLVLANDNKRAGEARGQGVSMVNLEKIRWINDTVESVKKTIRYFANPALATDDRLPMRIGELEGARIPSALLNEGRQPITPILWDYPLREVASIIESEKRELQQIYNINPLGMPNEGSPATATEIGIRNAEAERQSTADISRISRASGRVLKVVVDILDMRGIIKLDKVKKTSFKFDSPSVDLQSSEEINASQQYAAALTNMFGPGSVQMFNNPNEYSDWLRDKLKVSKSFASNKQEVAQKSQAMAQQSQQAMQQQGGGSQFKPAETVNPTEVGSVERTGFGL